MTELVLTLSCIDRKGIVGAVGSSIAAQDCNILESAQYFDRASGRFFMRVHFAAPEGMTPARFRDGFRPTLLAYDMDAEITDTAVKPRVMLMVSKAGHCLNDLLYRWRFGRLPMTLVSVVSNHETWRARVEGEGLAFHHIPVTADTKAQQEAALLALVDAEKVELIVLARYMQVLSDELSRRLEGRVINIHHSFLPSFKGAQPYHQAHARGVKLIGATAHYVTADLDEGPIIEQDVERIDHTMTADDMAAAGRDIESRVLARAVGYHLERRILLNGDRTIVFR
ncbi:formyltetrahydrofolate deformylase [Acuticoccus sp. I52.16.1]|uniref:formyltetrahydrofolate deformylase n=1 Tax=Acuticoccus sp. I52.16.1 TaxID=2928472 RepID=UPI001FD4E3A0|nr:formyltetrahydrofolate deformylase [Acuticoccus sp. I52.16.1]UOM34825.1 formyltetrahydrofolate deformylase [Acuticoccus sp. I52.16.1]